MRVAEKFQELKQQGKGGLIAYVCAGDPTPSATRGFVEALVRGGADIIELGLPFSDPVADGPTIQAASQRALARGMNPDLFFQTASQIKVKVPVLVMTYYNLIFHRGIEKFCQDALDAGLSGIIVPDLPADEAGELAGACKKHNLDLIFFVTPTTTTQRLKNTLKQATGFLYLVSRLGVTGARTDISTATRELLERVPPQLPRAVGFGISTPEQAKEIIRAGADAVIIGSAFVNIIAREGEKSEKKLEELAHNIKKSI